MLVLVVTNFKSEVKLDENCQGIINELPIRRGPREALLPLYSVQHTECRSQSISDFLWEDAKAFQANWDGVTYGILAHHFNCVYVTTT